ncbi:unnamed protein product [Caenorhabditis bovis]|uniref:Receptor L-domain domain-containing protein n=1 Tax=Caenorhabditis bovis TaxID=2654633 RepID=A0A8S1FAM2_9PELO|nr:unnamed protein product [Caenorhabditis bovis]
MQLLKHTAQIGESAAICMIAERLVNISRLSESLIIQNTTFTDFGFLKNLEVIDQYIEETESRANLIITKNLKLKSLGFSVKTNGITIDISENPKLCISPQEIVKLTDDKQAADKIFDVTICEDMEMPIGYCIIPKSGLLKDLPEYCLYIFGDLIIDENFNFQNSYKLAGVVKIFGSLQIKNTKLRTGSIFPTLFTIYAIKHDHPALEISNNKYLSDMFDVRLISQVYR